MRYFVHIRLRRNLPEPTPCCNGGIVWRNALTVTSSRSPLPDERRRRSQNGGYLPVVGMPSLAGELVLGKTGVLAPGSCVVKLVDEAENG